MLERDQSGSWDFTSAIELIRTLATDCQDDLSAHAPEETLSTKGGTLGQTINGLHKGHALTALGEFEDVWKFLRPSHSRDPREEHIKSVRWRDEVDGVDLADNEDEGEGEDDLFKGMSKVQRKKARRKARRAAQTSTVVNLSDQDADNNRPETHTSTNSVEEEQSKKSINGSQETEVNGLRRSKRLKAKAAGLTNGNSVATSSSEKDAKDIRSKSPDRKALIHDLLGRPLPTKDETKEHIKILKRSQPPVVPTRPVAKSQFLLQDGSIQDSYANAVAKKTKLLGMLKDRFGSEGSYLKSPELLHPSSNISKTSQGLHIFIDASNIMIGFHDALKVAHSMPLASRIRRQPISFHSLSLVLSRGRPTTKRVVVGSDRFTEMEEAKLLGYETNILDRVHKAKELTPRRKKTHLENGAVSTGSGSETSTAFVKLAPEKWVEQAVDEIIHLKMMESLVDATEPATMVLATGDAAEAEFSDGFLKMVERVLSKGWSVELVCWSLNMSSAYKNKAFRQKWGAKFKTIELDDYVELLLGS